MGKKIVVTAQGEGLDAPVDPRFGRCPYFTIVDIDTMEYESLPNEYAGAPGGAGIQSAQLVANKGVSAVVTGGVGPNAYQVLSAAGVEVIALGTPQGTVRELVEQYKKGMLRPVSGPTTPPHFGMGAGMGRGMGRGMGMGMPPGPGVPGAGMPSMGPAVPPGYGAPWNLSPEDELRLLRQEEKFVEEYLKIIRKRIKELGG